MKMGEIKSILEGAHPNTPNWLQYAVLDIEIPENANVIGIGQSRACGGRRLYLHRFHGIPTLEQSQEFAETRKKIKGIDIDKNLVWIFRMPRSITTRDGRIYVLSLFYEPRWEYYFPLIPTIKQDCEDIFKGRTTDEKLNALCKRAF